MRVLQLINRATLVLLAGCGLVAVFFVGQLLVRALGYPYILDYGEGPLLDQSRLIVQGLGIYRIPGDEPPWTVANYPPVYVALQAAGIAITGPNYAVGRVISLVSLLLAATAAGLIVSRLSSRGRAAGVLTGLLIITIPYVAGWTALARVDVLALGLSLAGLCAAVRSQNRAGLLAAILLLSAGILTKQTYLLAAPFAALVWTLSVSVRRAAALVAGVALVVGGTGGVLQLVSHGGFWFDVVTANVNGFDVDVVIRSALGVAQQLPVLLLAVPVHLVLGLVRRDRALLVSVPYLLGSLVSAAAIGKVGSNVNYLIELSAALAVITGLVAARLVGWTSARAGRAIGSSVAALLLAAQVALLSGPVSGAYGPPLARIADPEPDDRLLAIVRTADGPVLADDAMGLLPLAGRRIQLQPFELTQLAEAGVWNEQPVLDRIYGQEYAVIMIDYIGAFPLEEERWTPDMLSAIRSTYVESESVDGPAWTTVVYRPAR